ncbi:transferase activity, transferring acyl groups protein [[Candida] boidinii]|nr:transferase activity, transferring acyl groups protein [[Candida] boidinii]OWB84924.1 transferase activity, transferring acyl groups protein [[Candida] boidinii]GMF97730.1 unnamed protein product [[Candida] boidinii]
MVVNSTSSQPNQSIDSLQKISRISSIPIKNSSYKDTKDEDEKRFKLIKSEKLHESINYSKRLDTYQISVSFLLISLIHLLSIIPNKYNNFFKKFYTLQYKNNATNLYGIGIDDAYFLAYWVVCLIFIRSFLMVFLLQPLAHYFKIHKFKAIERFREQGWSTIYYSVSWFCGIYLYYKSDYFFNLNNIYKNWPIKELEFWYKNYYLIQTACWFQQIFVLNIEEKRKDYLQMFSHHIITTILCVSSYNYYFSRVGHVILIIMDSGDIFLSGAKMLKYCGFEHLCDIAFVLFVINWIILRHGCYNLVFYHAVTKAMKIMDGNCIDHPENEICYTDSAMNFFFILLGGLQIITIFWLFMILRVAWKVISGNNAEDVRSDDDDSE